MKKISQKDFKDIFIEKKAYININQENNNIFYNAMKDVKPIKDKKNFYSFEEKKLNLKQNINFDFAEKETFNDFKVTLLSKKDFSQIKNSKKPIESILDLHGKNVYESNILLDNFIKNSFLNGYRVVLIITGKGKNSTDTESGVGVLKSFFLSWIKDTICSKYVLSYRFAAEKHGGDGAFYLLLRKNKNL